MASDDLIRIVYRSARIHATAGAAPSPKATPRRNRTSISMDPDLYQTFCLIQGDVRAARAKLRQWATEADGERQTSAEATGVSRLVHKRMLAKIREVVEAGLTVLQNNDAGAAGAKGIARPAPSDGGDEWDNFQGGAAKSAASKAIKKAAKTAKKAPGKKGARQAAGGELGGSDQAAAAGQGGDGDTLADLPAADGLVGGAAQYTRERLVEDGADPFMG